LEVAVPSCAREALYKTDLHEVLGKTRFDEVEDVFHVLDRDGNGDVSLEEMTMLVIDISEDRKTARSVCKISAM
jgi:Ca2+-binding EF-hand superfamily protein